MMRRPARAGEALRTNDKAFEAPARVPFDTMMATRCAAAAALLIFGLSAWLAIEYRNEPILELHAFRQTQTALTSFWVCHGDFRLAYWTPVGGYPWSIPFEFPIYQWLVALIACPFDLNLDPVGRLVSYAFWIACLAPVWRICRQFFDTLAPLYFWTFAALFLCTPLYLFWGRVFLMESAALFFSLYFIAFSLALWFGRDHWFDAGMTGTFLTLALLQKSTTVLPLLLLALAYLWRALPDLQHHRVIFAGRFWKGIVAYVIPFLIGLAWVKYSDHVKMANAFGRFLTSDALSTWNFGTLAARFSEALWVKVFVKRVIGGNIAGYLGPAVILAGIAFAPKRRGLILCGVGLFLLYFMVFENLLFVHEYYPMSNTVYLVFALAVSIGGLIEERPKLAVVFALTFGAIIAVNLNNYFTGSLFKDERRAFDDNDPVLAVAKFVRERTAPTDRLLIYGDDWNSELPYYGQRLAFVVPGWFSPYLGPLDKPQAYLDHGPGAVLVCGTSRTDQSIVQTIAANYPHWPKTALAMCDIYLRKYQAS